MKIEQPKIGEKLFIPGKYVNMSYVSKHSPLEHISLYAEGYKIAGDELVKKSINSNSIMVKDSFVYPVMFLYRHYIELRLKEIYLKYSSEKVDVKELNHNLRQNWDNAKPIIKRANRSLGSAELEDTLSAMDDYIKQYSKKDLDSFIFRYPFSKNKNKDGELESYFKDELRIDLHHLKQRIQELENIFYGTLIKMEDDLNLKQELLSMYY